ncbi:MAG: tandem-95 repeat protein, partial [Myxococcaceae bacterium]
MLTLAACGGGPEVSAVFADPASFTTVEDTAVEGALQGTGPEGGALTFRAVTPPAHGTLELQETGAFRYIPAPDYAGEDVFTFAVSYDDLDSAPAEVKLTITPVADTPRIVGQPALSTPEDTPLALSLSSVQAIDPDGPISTGLRLIIEDGENYTVQDSTLTPAADFFGPLEVRVRVEDETGSSEPFPLVVGVTPVNDAPVVQGQATALVISEDVPLGLTVAALEVTDVDNPASELRVDVLPGADFTWAGGVLTPAANFHGTLLLDVEVSDGEASVPAQLELTVTPVNDAPVVTSQVQPLSTQEDAPFTLSLADVVASDVDSPAGALSFSVLDGPGYTHVGNAVTPAADFHGALEVLGAVSDGQVQSAPFPLQVTVVPVNDAPSITAQARPITTAEDTAFTLMLADVTVVDVDHPASALTVQVQSGPGYTHAGNTITPAPQFHGTLAVAVVVSDGAASSPPFSLQVTVTPVDDAPAITGQARSLVTAEDTALALTRADVTATDVDSTSLTLVVLNGTNYSHTGTTITPAANFHGPLQVNVAVSDGHSQSPSFPLQVTVTPVNDAPVITAQARALSTPEDTAITLALPDVTATDVDDSALILSVRAGTNYSHAGNTVTPARNFNGTLRIPVVVSDGQAQSAPFEVAVTVGSVNDAPVVTGQARALSTPEDTALTVTIPDLSVVDADHPASALSVQVMGGANYSASGATITPSANFHGNLQVPVRVTDGVDASAVFNLAVTVTPVNDPPRVTGQVALATDEETPLTLALANFTVDDPDDLWPQGFTLQVLPGTGYTRSGTTVTPAVGFVGTLSVQITVHDGDAPSAVYPAQITVRPVNRPPQAVADAYRTSGNTELVVSAASGVLANDSDRESSVTLSAFDATSANGS